MSSVEIEGYAVDTATVQIPSYGAWWIDVATPDPLVLSVGQRVTCRVADVEMLGTVQSGGAVDGRAAYRVVAGAGGWHRELAAKAYSKIPGVRVSEILRDAAFEVGESTGPLPATLLGPHYAREAGPAHRALNGLVPRAWYLDSAGVTQFGARPVTEYTGAGAVVRRDRALGVVGLDTDDLQQLVPGVRVDGQDPATDIEITLRSNKLLTSVYYAPRISRRLAAYADLFDALDPHRRFRATYEYRVVTQSSDRLDLQTVRRATGMPDLLDVPVRPGMAGLRADVALGSLVLVAYVDGDPSRPCVIGHAAPDDPGWIPLFLELGGPGALGVARVTDPVQAGPFAGVITSGSLRVKAVI